MIEIFLWVILWLFVFDIFGKIIILYQRDFTRKPIHLVFDAILNISMLVWVVVLLAKI